MIEQIKFQHSPDDKDTGGSINPLELEGSKDVFDSIKIYDDERMITYFKKSFEGKDISALKNTIFLNLGSKKILGDLYSFTQLVPGNLAFAQTKITEKDDQKMLLYSMIPLSSIQKDNPQINTLLAKKNVRFSAFPFGAEDAIKLFKNESDVKVNEAELNKQKDEELAHEISIIRHHISYEYKGSEDLSIYSQDRVKRFLDDSKRVFPDLQTKTDKEVFDFIYSIELNRPEKMKGQSIEGVYCDVEGTLLINGELNQEVVAKLREYENQGKQVTIWTDGNLYELTEKLNSMGIVYPIKSKFDFGGANAEIVIDNDDQNTFYTKTKIFPKEFIKV